MCDKIKHCPNCKALLGKYTNSDVRGCGGCKSLFKITVPEITMPKGDCVYIPKIGEYKDE